MLSFYAHRIGTAIPQPHKPGCHRGGSEILYTVDPSPENKAMNVIPHLHITPMLNTWSFTTTPSALQMQLQAPHSSSLSNWLGISSDPQPTI
jgi:hypothetical protein